MKVKIFNNGGSKGIRLPKTLIEEYKLKDEVELQMQSNGILIKPVVEDEFEDDENVRKYLRFFTGHNYGFAIGSSRKWGSEESAEESREEGYYQIMPDALDDGFFDWYIEERPYHQFFESKEKAIIYFLKYWWKWKKKKIRENKNQNSNL